MLIFLDFLLQVLKSEVTLEHSTSWYRASIDKLSAIPHMSFCHKTSVGCTKLRYCSDATSQSSASDERSTRRITESHSP